MSIQSAFLHERRQGIALAVGVVAGAATISGFAILADMLDLSRFTSGLLLTLLAAAVISTLCLCSRHRSPLGAPPGNSQQPSATAATAPKRSELTEEQSAERTESSVPSEREMRWRRAAVGLPAREHLLAKMTNDILQGSEEAVIAIIELRDYDRLYAFDPTAASSALNSFSSRLATVVDDKHPLAHVDRGSFGIWFNACSREAAKTELNAICYALRGEIVTPNLSLVPEVVARAGIYPADGEDPDALITRTLISARDASNLDCPDGSVLPLRSTSDARERYSLEQELRHAVEREQLELHFQPIVDLSLSAIVGAETLIRWNHPTAGRISPTRFVPILEDTDLIDDIGMWSLNAACRSCRKWRDQGRNDLTVAVNLSARQLKKSNLARAVARTLERHALPPSALCLELTETAAMEDAERTLALFRELRGLGVRLAIDDFGTGYSSLSYLMKLPFDKLKIDREFVVDVHRRRDSQAICRSLWELSKGLNIRLIVEGAEKEEEVSVLSKIGCTLFQGFYFSPPVGEEAFISLLGDDRWLKSKCSHEVSNVTPAKIRWMA